VVLFELGNGTQADVEYARKLLSGTSAESVETHAGEPNTA
jgi:hypothetical protein